MAILRDDPYGAFNYKVTIQAKSGIEVRGSFSDVTGLSTEVNYADYREGMDARNGVRKLPTTFKVNPVNLKRGVIGGTDLFAWLEQVRKGDPKAKAVVTIELLSEDRVTVVTWKLTDARPQKWTGPTLGAKATDVAMEELSLVAEDLEMS